MKVSRQWTAPMVLSFLTFAPVLVQAATWDTPTISGDYVIRNIEGDQFPVIITDGTTCIASDPDCGNDRTLLISPYGNLGLGADPIDAGALARFQIFDETPEIALIDTNDNRQWQLFANGRDVADPEFENPIGEMGFADITAGTIPFSIQSAAPFDSLRVTTSGNVGVGVFAPEAKLHVKGVTDGKILVENTPAVATQTELFEIKNKGNLEFYMTNTNASSSWKFVAGTQGNSPAGADSFRISKVGLGIRFQVFDTGNATLQGILTQTSDRNAKQDIVELNHETLLSKVMALPISEWSYKTDPDSRHIGPMAQDFYQAFQLGHTEKGISSIDTGGVALAAVQALNIQLGLKETRIDTLDQENQALQVQLQEQDARVQQLELAVTELLKKISPEQQVGFRE